MGNMDGSGIDLGLCEYKGCRKKATDMESWFGIFSCDEHSKIPPAFFTKEDEYYTSKVPYKKK